MINDIDINKIVVPNRFPFSTQDTKHLIGYKDSQKNRPLCIFCLQIIICKRYFDENRRLITISSKTNLSELIHSRNM